MYTANEAAPKLKLSKYSISLAANLTYSNRIRSIINTVMITTTNINKIFTGGTLGARGPGVSAGQVRADHHQLQAQREEQERKMVCDQYSCQC